MIMAGPEVWLIAMESCAVRDTTSCGKLKGSLPSCPLRQVSSSQNSGIRRKYVGGRDGERTVEVDGHGGNQSLAEEFSEQQEHLLRAFDGEGGDDDLFLRGGSCSEWLPEVPGGCLPSIYGSGFRRSIP